MPRTNNPYSKTDVNNPDQVRAYLAKLEPALLTRVNALRKIVKDVDKNITEQIKWNAPSFSYKGYLVTFNLHAPEQIRLIFHNGAILTDTSGLLQGDYPDRRIAYFTDLRDIKAKQSALTKVIKQWVKTMDQSEKKAAQ